MTYQKPRIDLVWFKKSLANDEDLGRLVTRSLRLRREDFLEELLEDPHQGVIIFRSEHFGHEPTAFPHEFGRQLREGSIKDKLISGFHLTMFQLDGFGSCNRK